MALTVDDIARYLKYDLDGDHMQDLQDLLDEVLETIRAHIPEKFDPENKRQQRAIKGLCGFYDEYRNGEKEMPPTIDGLPEHVRGLLMPFYKPLAM